MRDMRIAARSEQTCGGYGEPYVLPEGNIPICPGETLAWNDYIPGECLVICFESPTADDEYFGSLALGTEEGWTHN
jgi:hypothetical protein